MRKFWPLLFLSIPIAGVWLFWYAANNEHLHWWFPKDVSTHGHEIDFLFNVILWITGITFVLTEVCLVYFMFKYQSQGSGEKGHFVHGHHKAEVIWSVIPAGILLFIALYQYGTWKKVKFTDHFPKVSPTATILAGQFEWRIIYWGEDQKVGTKDDIEVVNEFHIPVNTPVIIHLQSRDVLHSFFLPNLRVKQDAVPGLTIPVWFQATETGNFDIVCAELCGWGHYKMKGRMTVQSDQDFKAWLKTKKDEQEVTK